MYLLYKIINEDTSLSKSYADIVSSLDLKKYLYNYEDPLLIKSKGISNREKGKFSFPNLNLYKIYYSSELSQEINDENNKEDISLMKKFIKDNANYIYASYDNSSSFYEEKKTFSFEVKIKVINDSLFLY